MSKSTKIISISELNKKDRWTKSEALRMMLYCVDKLNVMPSKKKILKAKNALKLC